MIRNKPDIGRRLSRPRKLAEEPTTLAALMLEWRIDYGLTAYQAAQYCWCTTQAWKDWEAGAAISPVWAKKIQAIIQDRPGGNKKA